MTLEQIAQQAMGYLDSVGVAAYYEINKGVLTIKTELRDFEYAWPLPLYEFGCNIMAAYPQKSPA